MFVLDFFVVVEKIALAKNFSFLMMALSKQEVRHSESFYCTEHT